MYFLHSLSKMDFLSNLTKNDEAQAQKVPDDADQAKQTPGSHKPSKSDLIHSAQVVADAAQSHFRSEPEKFDKSEVAGAAADLIDAAAEYAKLDDTQGIGKYVDKAEDYLRHYKGSASDPAPAPKPESTWCMGRPRSRRFLPKINQMLLFHFWKNLSFLVY